MRSTARTSCVLAGARVTSRFVNCPILGIVFCLGLWPEPPVAEPAVFFLPRLLGLSTGLVYPDPAGRSCGSVRRCCCGPGVVGLGVCPGEPTAWFPRPLQAPSVVPSGSDGWCGLLGLGWVAHLSVNSERVAAFRDCQWPPSCNGFWVRALGGEPAPVAPLSLCGLSRLSVGREDRGCRTRCARSRNAPIWHRGPFHAPDPHGAFGIIPRLLAAGSQGSKRPSFGFHFC